MTDNTMGSSGTAQGPYSYDSPGRRSLVSGTNLANLGFAEAYYQGASRLSLTQFHEYDPIPRRWLSRDPLGEYAGINLYGYVGGDPINWVDPFGLCWGPNGPGLFDGVGQALLSNISIVGGGGYGLGLAANGEVARNLNGGSLAVDGGLGLGGAAYAGIKGVIGADRSDFTIGGVGGAGLAGGISIGFDVHHFSYLGGTINLPLPNNVTFFGGIGAGGEGKVDIQPAANIVTVNVGNGGQVSSSGILGGSSGSSGGGGGSCR